MQKKLYTYLTGALAFAFLAAVFQIHAEEKTGFGSEGLICPRNVSFVVTVNDVSGFLTKAYNRALSTLEERDPGTATKLKGAKMFLQGTLGFDPTSPESCAKAGFDFSEPAHAVLLDFNERGKPKGAIIQFKINNQLAAVETMKVFLNKIRKREIKENPGQPNVYSYGKDIAFAATEGTMIISMGPRQTDKVEMLRSFLEDASMDPLTADPEFQKNAEKFSAGVVTGYVNVRSFHKVPRIPEALKDIKAAAASLGGKTEGASCTMKKDSALLKKCRPGAECREFMARFDKPALAVTSSSQDPLGLLFTCLETFEGKRHADRLKKRLSKRSGLEVKDVTGLFSKGAVGFLMYPEKKPGVYESFTVVAFARLANVPLSRKALDAMIESSAGGADGKKTDGDNVLYLDGQAKCMGIIDDYFVFGTAREKIEKVMNGQKQAWVPHSGGQKTLSAELSVKGLLMLLQPDFDKKTLEIFSRTIKGATLFADLETNAEGAVLKLSGIEPVLNPELFADNLLAGYYMVNRKAQSFRDLNNLRQLTLAAKMYSQENNERWPDKLSQTSPVIKNFQIYLLSDSTVTINSVDEIDTKSDYALVPGIRESMDPRTITIYSKRPLSNGMAAAAFLDGHVEMLKWNELQARLKKQGVTIPEEEQRSTLVK